MDLLSGLWRFAEQNHSHEIIIFFFGLKIEYDNKYKILPIQTSG